MVFGDLGPNVTEVCFAEVGLKDAVGARTALNADTAYVYSWYEDCHQADRDIPASYYVSLGFVHLLFQSCETACYVNNINLSLINYSGIQMETSAFLLASE